MHLYDLHSNPEKLHGFDIAPYKIPKLAFELAKKKPELEPKLEDVIMKDPYLSYLYAFDVLRRPWPEAESVIMKDPRAAFYYAFDVLKRPWPEAEPYIMKDPKTAYYYARTVLKRRWPEAEPYIMTDRMWHVQYYKYFFK